MNRDQMLRMFEDLLEGREHNERLTPPEMSVADVFYLCILLRDAQIDRSKLDRIAAIFYHQEEEIEFGRRIVTTDDAVLNLEAAITSIKHDGGTVSEVAMETLQRVCGQLHDISAILKETV